MVIHAADVQDGDSGDKVLLKMVRRLERLRVIWADGGHAGRFEAKLFFRRVIEIIKHNERHCFEAFCKW